MSMESDFRAPQGIQMHGEWGGTVQYSTDKNLVCIFYMKPVQNIIKSKEQGRPIFEDVIYVKMHPPGERLNIVDRPAEPRDRTRFPMQWNQFQENKVQVPDGTPVEMLYPDKPSVASMLRGSGVHTIEQLSDLSANAIETIGMGCQTYVNDAKRYLEAANKGVGAAQFRAELEQRDNQIRTLEHTIKMLQDQITLMQKGAAATVMNSLQEMIAGGQQRPTFPAGNPQSKAFDPQTAQIAATHPTRDLEKPKKKAAAPQKKQRERVRI